MNESVEATSPREETSPGAEGDNESSSKNKGFRKAPSRHRFEEELADLKQQIEEKEQRVQYLHGSGKDSPQTKLQQIRENRDVASKKRQNVNSQLTALNQQINTKRDSTAHLRSKLHYQSETQIDDIVSRLETQLKQNSFRLAEERRLVAEIDKLKRSKKAVKQYNDSKDELQVLRDTHQQLRAERDEISKEINSLRVQEDSTHTDIRKNREMLDVIKKELDELYERKRERVAEFKTEQSLYLQSRDQRRAELNRHRAQEKQAQAQARAQEREEIRISIEPYQEERNLCAALLSYLSKLEGAATPGLTPVTPSSSCVSSAAHTPITPDESEGRFPGATCEETTSSASCKDTLFLGVPRRPSRKVKRSNSKANKKRLVPLTPDLLSQFASLDISTPTSMTEVPAAVEALKAKQKLFACMAAAELNLRAAGSNGTDDVCAAGAEGVPTVCVTEEPEQDPSALQPPSQKLSPVGLGLDLPVQGHFIPSCPAVPEPPPSLPNGFLDP